MNNVYKSIYILQLCIIFILTLKYVYNYDKLVDGYINYKKNNTEDSFELKGEDIPKNIHKLYINNSINIIPFGSIKHYLPKYINDKNISNNTPCIYTYIGPQKKEIYNYDVNVDYINKKSHDKLFVNPFKADCVYCETFDDIPSCSILSCNVYNDVREHKNKMVSLINNNKCDDVKYKLGEERILKYNLSNNLSDKFNEHLDKIINI